MKKILYITLILLLMLIPLGCTKEEGKKDNISTQEVKLSFNEIGMNVSFNINKNLGYDNYMLESEEGLPPIATFDNKKLGLNYRISLVYLNKESYNELKSTQANSELYQELEYGDYKGFAFSTSDCYGEGYLILKEDDINLYALSLGVYPNELDESVDTAEESPECIGFSQYSKKDLQEMLSNLKIEEFDLEEDVKEEVEEE